MFEEIIDLGAFKAELKLKLNNSIGKLPFMNDYKSSRSIYLAPYFAMI